LVSRWNSTLPVSLLGGFHGRPSSTSASGVCSERAGVEMELNTPNQSPRRFSWKAEFHLGQRWLERAHWCRAGTRHSQPDPSEVHGRPSSTSASGVWSERAGVELELDAPGQTSAS